MDPKVLAFGHTAQIMHLPVEEPERTSAVVALAREASKALFARYFGPTAVWAAAAAETAEPTLSAAEIAKATEEALVAPIKDICAAAFALRSSATPSMLLDPQWSELCVQADRLQRALNRL